MQRVLIIEDDAAMNGYIGEVLTEGGWNVSSAFNGVRGLDAIRSGKPDLVVLDIFMPEKDGLEVLIELRRFAPDLPVLVISGKEHLLSESSMSFARQLGASDLLSKPFTPEELIDRVSSLAGAARPHVDPASQKQPGNAFARFCEQVRRFKVRLS
jgi:DNA-binding response OmpR family regulator